MDISGNTILITGGGSGIGRALAEAFQRAGNRIVITGRRREALEAAAAGLPDVAVEVLDIGNADAIRRFAEKVAADHPSLNVVINNAGIMPREDLLTDPVDLANSEATIATNLLGPIRLTAALLPHLRRQPSAAIVNVTSGLAFVPRADSPTYSATKASIHSYTQSLRHQLRDTSVQVIELAPPLVATDLTPGQSSNPNAMPLEDFIRETMLLFKTQPDAVEILVERVKRQRFAEANARHDAVFATINPRT